jgi:hypothetical protein
MKNNSNRYFLVLSLISLGLSAGYIAFRKASGLTLVDENFLVIPAFYLITGISHQLLLRSVSANPNRFQMNFMMAMAFKMMAYLAFLGLMFYISTDGITMTFVLLFFLCYLVYTGFEMLALRWYKSEANKAS